MRIFLLAVLILVVFGVADAEAENNTTVNAPDFTLKDTDGLTFNLSDYEDNKTIVMLFMFSTCEPTAKFVKNSLEPYSKLMDNESVAIISISVFGQDSEANLRDYAEEYNWRHAIEPNGDVEIAYGVSGTPKIFIIDKNGMIAYSHLGSTLSLEELELEVYNATLTDEEETEKETEGELIPPISLIPALISIGLIAIFRRK